EPGRTGCVASKRHDVQSYASWCAAIAHREAPLRQSRLHMAGHASRYRAIARRSDRPCVSTMPQSFSTSSFLAWAWIPLVLFAAMAQTARNAAQRSLTEQAGTLGATLVRFLYGLPFASAWVLALQTLPATTAPVAHFGAAYFAW